MSDKTSEELVIIRFTEPWSIQNGGSYNRGERAAFSPAAAKDILEKGCGRIESLPPKAASPTEPTKEVQAPKINRAILTPRSRARVTKETK